MVEVECEPPLGEAQRIRMWKWLRRMAPKIDPEGLGRVRVEVEHQLAWPGAHVSIECCGSAAQITAASSQASLMAAFEAVFREIERAAAGSRRPRS